MYQSVGTNVAVYIAQALDLPLFRKLNSNYIIAKFQKCKIIL
jgi:hypothetical protein